jgi:aryl sulfotransferase
VLSAEQVLNYEQRAESELGPDCAHWFATGEFR